MSEASPLQRYLGIGFVFTVAAVLLTVLLWPLLQWFPAALFLLAVLVSAWRGGVWQGLTTTGFSLIALLFFYRATTGEAGPPPWFDVAWRSVLFVLVGALASYLSHQCRRALTALDRVHGTLTSLGDGLVFADAGGNVRFLNPAGETLTGWTAADALGQPVGRVFRCVHGDGKQSFSIPFARVTGEGATLDLPADAVLIDAKGAELFIEGKLTPHREQADKIVGVVIAFRDVTKRRQEEREVRRREEQFRAIAGYAPACVLQFDPQGQCISANAAWQSTSGQKPEECQGDGWSRAILSHDRQRLVAEWQGAIRGGRDFSGEFRLQTRRDESRWVQFRSAPMLSQRGQLLGHVAVVEDVDARRQAESSLRATENRFTAFMRNLPGPAYLKDAEGRYVYANDRYAGSLGWEAGEWNGKTDAELLPKGQPQPFCTQSSMVLENLEDYQSIETLQGPAGKQTFLVRQFPVEGIDEEVLLGGLAVELTAQKQAEAALQQAREEFERRWQDRANDLKRSEEALKKLRTDMEKQAAENTARQKQTEEILRTARQELEQRTAELRRAEKALADAQEEHQWEVTELTAAKQKAEAALKSTEERFDALIDEQAAEHEEALTALRQQLAEQAPRLETLEREKAALSEELLSVQQEAIHLRQEKARLQTELDLAAAAMAESPKETEPAEGLVLVSAAREAVTSQIVVNSWRLVDSMETWRVREPQEWLSYN